MKGVGINPNPPERVQKGEREKKVCHQQEVFDRGQLWKRWIGYIREVKREEGVILQNDRTGRKGLR